MAYISLLDSMTRKERSFLPFDPHSIKMYVCGPTVYDRAHLGNARSAVVFDQLFRVLQHKYGAGSVVYARNFTDVDDKIIARSEETGEPIDVITNRTIGWYHADMDALNVLRPTHEPRATDSIDDMIAVINNLIDAGHAYEHNDHVLFDVQSYADYGKLSGRTKLSAAVDHPELNAYKRNAGDFVLWKPSDNTQPGWPSPWGVGRPGWHIECSAMSYKTLGHHLDIHGGGIDLKFPHHENEIAQSVCAHNSAYGSYWIHNEMVTVNGAKMSKSLGNIVLVNDLIQQYDPLAVRYLLLGTHYRKPLDFTEERLQAAQRELRKWTEAVDGVFADPEPEDFVTHLYSNINVPGSVGVMRRLFKQKHYGALKSTMDTLGLLA